MEETATTTGVSPAEQGKRPFLLTLLCVFSFVFFGFIACLFLVATLFSGTIADMVLRYAPEQYSARAMVFFYTSGGFLLHTLSFFGIILMWKMKRKGYFFFGISSLIIASYQVFASQISPITTGLYVFLIVAFGLFIRKLR